MRPRDHESVASGRDRSSIVGYTSRKERYDDREAPHMFKALFLLFVTLWPAAAGKNKDVITETRNVPLAYTLFEPTKLHTARGRYRLATYWVKVAPFIVQSLDKTNTKAGVRLVTFTTFQSFTFAPAVIVADGKTLYHHELEWKNGISLSGTTEEALIDDLDLLRALSEAHEVYFSVLFSSQAPFDHYSIKLTPEQIEDCKLILGKYEELIKEK